MISNEALLGIAPQGPADGQVNTRLQQYSLTRVPLGLAVHSRCNTLGPLAQQVSQFTSVASTGISSLACKPEQLQFQCAELVLSTKRLFHLCITACLREPRFKGCDCTDAVQSIRTSATRGPSLSGLSVVYKTHGLFLACVLAGRGRNAFLKTQIAWGCPFTWSLTAHETLPCVPQPRHG